MAGTQPIVCSILKVNLPRYPYVVRTCSHMSQLPPDQAPFFRLKDVLEDMLRKFDHLNLVLAAMEDKDAAQLLRGTRTAMAEHATTVLRAIDYTNDVSSQVTELVDIVATDPMGKNTPGTITYTTRWAGSTANHFETGDKGITQLIAEMETMAKRVASLFGDAKPGMPRDNA